MPDFRKMGLRFVFDDAQAHEAIRLGWLVTLKLEKNDLIWVEEKHVLECQSECICAANGPWIGVIVGAEIRSSEKIKDAIIVGNCLVIDWLTSIPKPKRDSSRNLFSSDEITVLNRRGRPVVGNDS